jgi:hypothetical protein
LHIVINVRLGGDMFKRKKSLLGRLPQRLLPKRYRRRSRLEKVRDALVEVLAVVAEGKEKR